MADRPPRDLPPGTHGRDWVAIILAVGLAAAINTITAAVLYDAIAGDQPGLSENATQILVASFGGIIGVLGSYVGYRAGAASTAASQRRSDREMGDDSAPPV